MPKYDKRFALKCDQQFKDDLEFVAAHYKMSQACVIRTVVYNMREELR